MLNLRGSREIGELAGRPHWLGGWAWRRGAKASAIRPDANLDAGNYVSRGGSKADGLAQCVQSAFAEVNLPLLKSAEPGGRACALDQYSDYGNSTTPKLGLKWKAMRLP